MKGTNYARIANANAHARVSGTAAKFVRSYCIRSSALPACASIFAWVSLTTADALARSMRRVRDDAARSTVLEM